MAKPTFNFFERNTPAGPVRLVEFEIPGGTTSVPEFAEAVREIEAQLPGKAPVFFSGRGPVWGYCMLVHAAHPTPATGTFDPRLGYIVTASHDERFPMGKIIELA